MAAQCYARDVGDCGGAIEDEHFLPLAIQRMLGPVTVAGFAWQDGATKEMVAGSYAHSRIICQRHHDELDGLDGNALAYFQNLMLIAGGVHLATGQAGRRDHVAPTIDGRGLERWFLKTICGAIAAGAIEGVCDIPSQWVGVLFSKNEWPEEWSFYVETGTRRIGRGDERVGIQFHWSNTGALNGIVIDAFTVKTLFSLVRPDRFDGALVLQRPRGLGASVARPGGAAALVGMAPGEHVTFRFRWP